MFRKLLMTAVATCFASGVASAVEVTMYYPVSAGGPIAQAYESLAQPERIERTVDVDMRAHPQRMDAGIGTPGGKERDGMAHNRLCGLLDRLLDRRPMGLPLKPHERRAIEFEGQRITRHQPFLPMPWGGGPPAQRVAEG